MGRKGSVGAVVSRERISRKKTSKSKHRSAQQLQSDGIDYSKEIDPAKLVDLSFDTLSVISHRITSEQLALNEVLGPLGHQFDSAMFALTNKMLYQDPFVDADEFMDVLYDLIVDEGKVCTKRYFLRWLKEKPHDKGKTGRQRIRHKFSGQRNLLLRNRRMYILYPSPRILFGCLASFNPIDDRGYKVLGKSDDDTAPNTSNVYLEIAPFGPPDAEVCRSVVCSALINSAYGCFFGVGRIIETPGNSSLQVANGRQVPTEETSTGMAHYNPWIELIDCTRKFLDQVVWFFSTIVQIVPQLANAPSDDDLPEPASIAALRWPHLSKFRDLDDLTVQAMSVFEIVSSVQTYMGIIDDFTENFTETVNGEYAGISQNDSARLSSHTADMRLIIDRYLTSIYNSDLHFFFAYFRGTYIQY